MVMTTSMEHLTILLCVSAFIYPVLLNAKPTETSQAEIYEKFVTNEQLQHNENETSSSSPRVKTTASSLTTPTDEGTLLSSSNTSVDSSVGNGSTNTSGGVTQSIQKVTETNSSKGGEQTSVKEENSTVSTISKVSETESPMVTNNTENGTTHLPHNGTIETSSSTVSRIETTPNTIPRKKIETEETKTKSSPTPKALPSTKATKAPHVIQDHTDIYIGLGYAASFVFLTIVLFIVCCVRSACAKTPLPKREKKQKHKHNHSIEMTQRATTFSDFDSAGNPRKSF